MEEDNHLVMTEQTLLRKQGTENIVPMKDVIERGEWKVKIGEAQWKGTAVTLHSKW